MSKPNLKVGDEVRILDGCKIHEGDSFYWWVSKMSWCIGHIGIIIEIEEKYKAVHLDIPDVPKMDLYGWRYEWIEKDENPFDVDTFASYLKSDV